MLRIRALILLKTFLDPAHIAMKYQSEDINTWLIIKVRPARDNGNAPAFRFPCDSINVMEVMM